MLQSIEEVGIEEGIEIGIEKGVKIGVKIGVEKRVKKGVEKGVEIGVKIGVKIGVIKGVEGTAKNLLKSGLLTNRQIADVTGLKLKRVNELAKALKTQAEQ